MSVNISYMGTKRQLAPLVAEVIATAQAGILLDAFSGMCSVAEAVGAVRPIWTNDSQLFAAEVGAALFTSRTLPPATADCVDKLYGSFQRRRSRLKERYQQAVHLEEAALRASSYTTFSALRMSANNALNEAQPRDYRRRCDLFSRTYAGSFFGVRQAIETDSIIGAINDCYRQEQIAADTQRWMHLALGRALIRCATSTGHFAQCLRPKPNSFRTFSRQRQRRIWSEFLIAIADLAPIGDAEWRQSNKAYYMDSLDLLPRLKQAKRRPSVVYADPPYTDDQYSRYYHLLDTMILYDYPKVTGAGLYRPGRFQTPFSIKSRVVWAMEKLVRTVAASDAELVMSYPTNGLLHETGTKLDDILKKHFRSVERCVQLPHVHSTFGASKGPVTARVTEVIYMARQ